MSPDFFLPSRLLLLLFRNFLSTSSVENVSRLLSPLPTPPPPLPKLSLDFLCRKCLPTSFSPPDSSSSSSETFSRLPLSKISPDFFLPSRLLLLLFRNFLSTSSVQNVSR